MAETGESQIQGLTRRVAVEAKQKATIAGVAFGVFPTGPVIFDTLAQFSHVSTPYRVAELVGITAAAAIVGGIAGRKIGTAVGAEIVEQGEVIDAKAGPFIDRFLKPPAAPVRVTGPAKPKGPSLVERLQAKRDALRTPAEAPGAPHDGGVGQ